MKSIIFPEVIEGHFLNNKKGFTSFPCVIWFTGISGSGKTSAAKDLSKKLSRLGIYSALLDGDSCRVGLSEDLGFSDSERSENNRRLGEVAKLFYENNLLVIVSAITPFEYDRQKIRKKFPKGKFIEIFVDCPLTVCERRDKKGLYTKARNATLEDFTGITSEYQIPKNPEIKINTQSCDIDSNTFYILNNLKNKKIIPASNI